MRTSIIAIITGTVFVFGIASFVLSDYQHFNALPDSSYTLYEKQGDLEGDNQKEEKIVVTEVNSIVQHIPTPNPVRAVYMSSWVAGTKRLRDNIVGLIDRTLINAVVIDIKDDTGKISFIIDHPLFELYDSMENRIPDIREFIAELHEKDIYVIGRISSFQDTYLAPKLPHLAVQTTDGAVWRDRKGLAWFDPGAEEIWEYIITLAEESYAVGFDEINVDYVRFPSDGNMKNIIFPITGTASKSDTIARYFKTLDERLRFEKGIYLSADIFGMVTTTVDDMGIGQIFEKIVPHVDYIAPMIYPSHYPSNFHGYANPAEHPYEIITIANKGAIDKLHAMGEPLSKLRPWLQDFNLGATYTAEKVYSQIQAGEDLGVSSWMMWDASNTYTESAYQRIIES